MSVRTLQIAGATVHIFQEADRASESAAQIIALTIDKSIKARNRAVLGLATGRTPIAIYEHLVSLYRSNKISFENVSTYNLDEYYPMSPDDTQSYRHFMTTHLFQHVDILANRTHLFDATVPEEFVAEHTASFDRWIAAEGGLDFQLLGIGRNGHIGFNEPSNCSVEVALRLPSRLMRLHPTTTEDAAVDFGSESLVPHSALTMGIAQIVAARSILICAFGVKKSEILAQALHGPITPGVPASLLQTIADRVTWLVDEPAAAGL